MICFFYHCTGQTTGGSVVGLLEGCVVTGDSLTSQPNTWHYAVPDQSHTVMSGLGLGLFNQSIPSASSRTAGQGSGAQGCQDTRVPGPPGVVKLLACGCWWMMAAHWK